MALKTKLNILYYTADIHLHIKHKLCTATKIFENKVSFRLVLINMQVYTLYYISAKHDSLSKFILIRGTFSLAFLGAKILAPVGKIPRRFPKRPFSGAETVCIRLRDRRRSSLWLWWEFYENEFKHTLFLHHRNEDDDGNKSPFCWFSLLLYNKKIKKLILKTFWWTCKLFGFSLYLLENYLFWFHFKLCEITVYWD